MSLRLAPVVTSRAARAPSAEASDAGGRSDSCEPASAVTVLGSVESASASEPYATGAGTTPWLTGMTTVMPASTPSTPSRAATRVGRPDRLVGASCATASGAPRRRDLARVGELPRCRLGRGDGRHDRGLLGGARGPHHTARLVDGRCDDRGAVRGARLPAPAVAARRGSGRLRLAGGRAVRSPASDRRPRARSVRSTWSGCTGLATTWARAVRGGPASLPPRAPTGTARASRRDGDAAARALDDDGSAAPVGAGTAAGVGRTDDGAGAAAAVGRTGCGGGRRRRRRRGRTGGTPTGHGGRRSDRCGLPDRRRLRDHRPDGGGDRRLGRRTRDVARHLLRAASARCADAGTRCRRPAGPAATSRAATAGVDPLRTETGEWGSGRTVEPDGDLGRGIGGALCLTEATAGQRSGSGGSTLWDPTTPPVHRAFVVPRRQNVSVRPRSRNHNG